MKKDLLKKISKVLVVMLVLGMFMSNARVIRSDDEPADGSETYTAHIVVVHGTRMDDDTEQLVDLEGTYTINAGENCSLGFCEPIEGYFQPAITLNNGSPIMPGDSYSVFFGDWDVSRYVNDGYPNGWVRVSGYLIHSNVDVKVEFLPIEYKIAFDANGGEGSMDAIDAKYDEAVGLPECTMTNGDLYFVEWNTKPDGSGESYDDQEDVISLTTDRNTTVTLYAQWQEDPVYVYEEVDEVSFKITPPKAGDKITIDVETYSQDPQPTVTLPSGAVYTNTEEGEILSFWIKSDSLEGDSFEDIMFQGTYKAGDTFYALVVLVLNEEVEEGKPNTAVTDIVEQYFARDLEVNVEGAELVSAEIYEYGQDFVDVIVKGKIEEKEPEPEPDPKPIVPIEVPKTGIEGSMFPSFVSCISMLGLCLTVVVLNKRR
ncbi:MAG: InlB B-repeat-containing protein [Erysipelotrichaceae bacterium]|nr:InlB B-repeat-containing protein [Erysipelotrichaceae bacterium]